jgi:hypothetical protein
MVQEITKGFPLTKPDEVETIMQGLIGQKVTIFRFSEMGFPVSMPCTITGIERKKYAQYDNLLHVFYKLPRKKGLYVIRVYDRTSLLVYVGHVALRDSMFVSSEESGACTVRKSLVCFSDKYFEIALSSTEEKPVINLRHKIIEEEEEED